MLDRLLISLDLIFFVTVFFSSTPECDASRAVKRNNVLSQQVLEFLMGFQLKIKHLLQLAKRNVNTEIM